MKTIGAAAVFLGFVLWFGGEFFITPYNLIGVPILFLGAVLYFLGRRNSKPEP